MPPRNPPDPERPISVWKEKDSINGEIVDVLVIILNGPGCKWSKKAGCTMCGYNQGSKNLRVTSENLVSQMKLALGRYDNEPYIKIFTSSSFLDPEEIPIGAQELIFREISNLDPDVRLLIESRPEFVKKENLTGLIQIVKNVEIAIGLESSSNIVRAENIRKGFTWDDYLSAGKVIEDLGLKLKTYLLLKPPLLGEADSINDSVTSISEITKVFPDSRISINPMNVQSGTDVEVLFRRGIYRPPWLWSLLEVLKRGFIVSGGAVHIMSSPTAGGKRRGAHNCGDCDDKILDAIEEFSMINNPDHLEGIHHGCMIQWENDLLNSITCPECCE